MKKRITLFLTCFSFSLLAQTITISSGGNCYSGCVFTQNGTTNIGGVTRNTYTTPSPCGGFNSTIIYVNLGGGRWEIQTGGAADFTSLVRTSPNPPCTNIGSWTGSACGTLSMGMGSSCASTLPIELTQFDVQNTEGSKNHLSWRTESEKDNKHFDIERSTDGSTFHSIGQVKGNNKPSSYQFVDNQPFATSYYRLRQIDFDGTETFSKIVSVQLKDKAKGLTIYPTLVSNGILSVDTEGGQLRDFSVTNLLGQQVLFGKTTTQIDVSSLAKGTYMLKVGSDVAKFVKQ